MRLHLYAEPQQTIEVADDADTTDVIRWDRLAWRMQRTTEWKQQNPRLAALWLLGRHEGPPPGWLNYPGD